MANSDNFQPDWASAPGDTLADILAERNLSAVDLARWIGRSPEEAEQLLAGGAVVDSEIAKRLEAALGASAEFWMNREAQFRRDFARLRGGRSSEEDGWLRGLPLRDMIKFGWLKPTTRENDEKDACLRFFGVSSVNAWRQRYGGIVEAAAFRTSSSFASHPAAVAAWLRRGEIESESVSCSAWNTKRFKETLDGIRSLTRWKNPDDFLPELKKRCAECGVAVAVVRAPSGCRASGATRFLSENKALLLLSFRYLSDDHFWFTFFHEAGHLLLHGKKALFLEGMETISTEEEQQANEFAANALIPPEFRATLTALHADARKVIRFAVQIGVSPGVVVGQLQHLGRIRRNQLNGLKRRFTWERSEQP